MGNYIFQVSTYEQKFQCTEQKLITENCKSRMTTYTRLRRHSKENGESPNSIHKNEEYVDTEREWDSTICLTQLRITDYDYERSKITAQEMLKT